tara:strand:+ start:171 stop:668 length:498 start_codon:yes stop_codon:yes gene_type:complete
MNIVKISLASLVTIMFFNTSAIAQCDFEKVSLGDSLSSFGNKYLGESFNNTDDYVMHSLSESQICDGDFKGGMVDYHFIDKELHHIRLSNYISDADYLRNLKIIYGQPTSGYDAVNEMGIAYYFWDKGKKGIYYIQNLGTSETSVEITSSRFSELTESFHGVTDE